MAPDQSEPPGFPMVWPNVVSMLILASMTVSLLALAPWGYDILYSGTTHFLILWPLLLLALLSFVAWAKLGDEDREVPDW